jgi:alpha-1,2-mannosyltransferase
MSTPHPRRRRWRTIGGTALVIGLLAWNVWLAHAMVSRLAMGDFGTLYLSAAAARQGKDMYRLPPETLIIGSEEVVQPRINLNPPHLQALLLPLAGLPPAAALALWSLASLAALLLSIRILVREAGVKLTGPLVWRAAGWLLAFAGTGAVIGTGQVSFLLLLPFTLAWVAARENRWERAGLYLGVVMSLKLFLLVFVPYLVLRRQIRAAVMACASGLGCFGVGLLAFGVASHQAWLAQLGRVQWAWRSMNASFLGILTRTFTETPQFTPLVLVPDLVLPVWLVGALFLGLATVGLAAADSSEHAVDRGFALLVLGALLASPLGWIYYLWLALGPIAALAVTWSGSLGGAPTVSAADRVRRALLALAIPGLVWPYFAALAFPSLGWATATLGSAYFWATLAVWGALVADWRSARARTTAGICAGDPPRSDAPRDPAFARGVVS